MTRDAHRAITCTATCLFTDPCDRSMIAAMLRGGGRMRSRERSALLPELCRPQADGARTLCGGRDVRKERVELTWLFLSQLRYRCTLQARQCAVKGHQNIRDLATSCTFRILRQCRKPHTAPRASTRCQAPGVARGLLRRIVSKSRYSGAKGYIPVIG